MRTKHCMHKLLLFLDKFCIMILLLFLSVNHYKKMHLKPIFLHIRPSALTKPNDWDHVPICKNSPCMLVKWMWGLAKKLVDWWVIDLCWGIRVLIGLEKLECTKRAAHAICYVFLRMSSWKLESVLLVNKFRFQNFSNMSSWKFTCGQVKD